MKNKFISVLTAFPILVSFLTVFLIAALSPLSSYTQITISGRVLNQADTKPIANASAFLNNTTIGDKTAASGVFALRSVKPGKYELLVSIIGFEAYKQNVTVANADVNLGDIILFPNTTQLNEVRVTYKKDPNRESYLNLFTDEFLGASETAKDCKILNPQILDLDYDEATKTLKASSGDFLEIENDALGYKIKYLLNDFTRKTLGPDEKRVYYLGAASFEELKGNSSRERRWQQKRLEVYANSPVHFLRSALADRLTEEGFRVLQVVKLPKGLEQLNASPLTKQDIIQSTAIDGQYKLECDGDGLYVSYNKDRRFHKGGQLKYLYNTANTENTLIKFNTPDLFFNGNGVIANPYGVLFYGVWGRNRVAEMLPENYERPQTGYKSGDLSPKTDFAAKADSFLSHHPAEKAYLQFDKPYYASGDTVYFKAYVTLGEKHMLSGLSGVLHVDLINTNDKIDQSIKLQLNDGIAWGDFALPDSLPQGNYRVRAYTQWMRNEGEDVFFDKAVPIGSALNNKIPESGIYAKNTNSKPDLQFFPEGGQLVTGITSRVAFKAIGANGLGIAVKGTIADNTGKIIIKFSTTHLGMGCFELVPEAGKTYTAKITYAGGLQDNKELPIPVDEGMVLKIDNQSPAKAAVEVIASDHYFAENRNKNISLLVYTSGFVNTVSLTLDSAIKHLAILKRHLQNGITRVTLFSSKGEPVSERLFFVQNPEKLVLNLNTDKTQYQKREKVHLKLRALNRADSAVSGHFSVSVTDESKVPVNENEEQTIMTHLLLTSELKGYIEQPNYYFNNPTDKTQSDLDLLMLTHGYRKFEWKKLLNNEYPPIAYQPEKGLEISGQIKNLLNEPISKATINLIQPKGGQLLSTTSDNNGMFHFSNLEFADTSSFLLSAVNAKGKNSTKITYLERPDAPSVNQVEPTTATMPDTAIVLLLNNEKVQQQQFKKRGPGNGIMLKEVKIKDRKISAQRSQSYVAEFAADQVIQGKDITYGGPLSVRLMGLLHHVFFIGGLPIAFTNLDGRPMEILVDGAPGNLDDVSTDGVEKIEVLTPPNSFVYGGTGGRNGVLVITTKRRTMLAEDIAPTGVLPIASVGFYRAREFYSPKYDHPNDAGRPSELRSTIYWKPEIKTDKEGNASIDYYNADGTGTYKVTVEGIDENGNLGRQVYRYKVE